MPSHAACTGSVPLPCGILSMKPPRPWQGSGRWSGYRDSNPGPPAPKAGALTGLRYIPFVSNGAKITHFQQTPNPIGFHAEKTPPPQIIPALSDQTASLRPSSKPPWLAAPSPPAAVPFLRGGRFHPHRFQTRPVSCSVPFGGFRSSAITPAALVAARFCSMPNSISPSSKAATVQVRGQAQTRVRV